MKTTRSPDRDVYDYETNSGIFSIDADLRFDRHLNDLRKYVKTILDVDTKHYEYNTRNLGLWYQ